MTEKITFIFKGKNAKKAAKIFMRWYLDDGGDNGFYVSCTENENIEFISDWTENEVIINTDVETD